MYLDDIQKYLTAGNSALEIAKSAIGLLPKGREADKATREIERAEEALEASRAQLAQALGYKLCKCKFPPQIMLWKEDIKANVCSSCGHDDSPPAAPQGNGYSWASARRGR